MNSTDALGRRSMPHAAQASLGIALSSVPRYTRVPDVCLAELEDEAVLLDLNTSTLLGLNRVAWAMWTLLVAGQSLDEIVTQLSNRYDIAPELLHSDLKALLEMLLQHQLVHPMHENFLLPNSVHNASVLPHPLMRCIPGIPRLLRAIADTRPLASPCASWLLAWEVWRTLQQVQHSLHHHGFAWLVQHITAAWPVQCDQHGDTPSTQERIIEQCIQHVRRLAPLVPCGVFASEPCPLVDVAEAWRTL